MAARDSRDGPTDVRRHRLNKITGNPRVQLKIIEVNGRLTAGHPLVTRGGAPIDVIIYCHLTGQELPHFESYSQTLRR